MSFYLLHILNNGCFLRKERGNLVCEYKDSGQARQIALEDLRGIIIAAPDIVLSDSLIRSVLMRGAFILHCNDKYQPIGITEPLQQLVKVKVARHQAQASESLNQAIWQRLLIAKISNQIHLLKYIKAPYQYLKNKLKEKNINESACARYYWRQYFNQLGYQQLTRRGDTEHLVNGMLNYGYAVLGGLCHRALVAHGLSPLLGVHHQGSFHNHPLVYDVIEPWRLFIDYYLYQHLLEFSDSDMQDWIKVSRYCWEHAVVIDNNNSQKLVDAIDYGIQSLAAVFSAKTSNKLWLPTLTLA